MTILVTGANGFVGAALCRRLVANGYDVAAAIRRDGTAPPGTEARLVGSLGPETDWRKAIRGVKVIVHLAARAHVMRDEEADPLAVFRRTNRDGALRLAEQAAGAGVRRLVFASSIKVNGESTPPDRPFRPDDTPLPRDPYGVAKAEAEAMLADVATRSGLDLVVVRPPLVHGPGAKGNLAALMAILARGLPLPLGAVCNSRSMVGVDNLAAALEFLAFCPGARGTYLVRDDENISTPELIGILAHSLGRPARLVPVPTALLSVLARFLGRGETVRRLTDSLTVDDSSLRALGWAPEVRLADGLARMGKAWRAAQLDTRVRAGLTPGDPW